MYKKDNKIIADFLLASPDHMVRGFTFVLLSIQQPTQGLADKMFEVDQQGLECRHLNYGKTVTKRDGLAYVQANKRAIFERLTHRYATTFNNTCFSRIFNRDISCKI